MTYDAGAPASLTRYQDSAQQSHQPFSFANTTTFPSHSAQSQAVSDFSSFFPAHRGPTLENSSVSPGSVPHLGNTYIPPPPPASAPPPSPEGRAWNAGTGSRKELSSSTAKTDVAPAVATPSPSPDPDPATSAPSPSADPAVRSPSPNLPNSAIHAPSPDPPIPDIGSTLQEETASTSKKEEEPRRSSRPRKFRPRDDEIRAITDKDEGQVESGSKRKAAGEHYKKSRGVN